ncbi:MAG: NAD-dependent epimerase/dehydratase family protein [Balneolaceae bacterium]
MNSKKTPSVLIVGCGWLGKKLGAVLTSQNYKVYGTTRSSSNFSEFSKLKINPVKLILPVQKKPGIYLPKTDTVIISLAPGKGKERENYVSNVNQLAQYLSEQNVNVIMYSSTSVYSGNNEKTAETDTKPDKDSDNVLLAAEGTLLEYCPDAVILRLCGLYGEERHPATYMAGRKNIPDGDAPVNLVHSDDVVQVTQKVIESKLKGEIFNVCSTSHPAKKEIYTDVAERMELKKPKFLDGGENSKIISSEKLMKKLKVKLLHPDPAEFMAE